MKRTILALALFAVGAAAFAQDESLEPVIVEHVSPYRAIENCTPPNGAPQCAYYHELIRENFTPHEIALLFGPATAYPDFRTSYSLAREHYAAFIANLEENGMPVPVPADSSAPADSY